MSKRSVFKFNVEGSDKNAIEEIVKDYIAANGLTFDEEEQMYTTQKPSKKNDVKNAALSVGATLLTGQNTVYYSMGRGLDYVFEDNQLLLRACVINRKMKNAKQMIHSTLNNSQAATWFYRDLKEKLFKPLEANGAKLTGKEVETIQDGSGKVLAKTLLIILGCTIAFIVLLLLLL